jgi:hypothetical protein
MVILIAQRRSEVYASQNSGFFIGSCSQRLKKGLIVLQSDQYFAAKRQSSPESIPAQNNHSLARKVKRSQLNDFEQLFVEPKLFLLHCQAFRVFGPA